MIRGYATQEATEAHMQKHPVAGRRLGLAQLTVSQAGFGCYRVSAGVAHHEKALRRALREGINLIDTSTNYADGGSESLIGPVFWWACAAKPTFSMSSPSCSALSNKLSGSNHGRS